MTLLNTYAKARGLQRCSTRTCVCCGADSRQWLGGQILLECWATDPDGSMHAAAVERHLSPACAKCVNKAMRGQRVFVRHFPDCQQLRRVVILELQ